ncbi:hypothetical protein ACFVYD_34340 [Streptomyces sp. NPDC058301]|uniref:SCO2400 family protein n=1 Tax=Streptomyces sp. NPDC058301 TaxID=3346436 RepID=UPI0036E49001
MDYCHACRRHLNGALACAGCGTPAEELRQPEIIDLGVYESAASGADPAPAGHRRARREPPRARPRRRARKRRGRLVLFGSAGVVLAAGALGLAQLALEPPPDDRGAATSVHEEEKISQETTAPAPDPSDVGGPKRPSAVPARDGHGKGHPRPGGTHAGPGGSATGTGAGTGPGDGPPAPGGSHPATGPTGAPSPPAPTPTDAGGSPLPSTSPQPSTSDAPPPPAPPPTPTPTKTCDRFLWWCL